MTVDQKTIQTYDQKAADYLTLVGTDGVDEDLAHFINHIPTNGLVLDLGCGPGNSAAAMMKAGLQTEAIDASANMVALAREQYSVNARQASFADLDRQHYYDGIWANFSLLHASRDDFPDHITAIHRALKVGGFFHIGMKTGNGSKRDPPEEKK